jgi:hypothetical protein
MILIFQVAAGVFLGFVAFWGAYGLWLTWRALPKSQRQPFDLKKAAKSFVIWLVMVVAGLGYIVLADMGWVPCWMLVDDSDWREIAKCNFPAKG